LLSVAWGVAAATPVMSDPLDKARVTTSGHRTIHRATFSKATALAAPSPVSLNPPSHETDGLSRSDGDCNDGCIDH
jgi:Tfp pilus assembly protein FimT